MRTTTLRRGLALGMVLTAGMSLAACSEDSSAPDATGNAAEGSTTTEITFWDPYPQHKDGSAWDTHVKACAPEGSRIKRSSAPQTDLLNSLTTAVKEGNAPDVVMLDNPAVPDAAASGLLASADEVGIDTRGSTRTSPAPAPSTA